MLLQTHLMAALELYQCDRTLPIGQKSPPLKRTQQQGRVLYVSAIAFWLSQFLKSSALDIASALAELVRHQTDGQDFTVQVIPPGWLYLELTQPYLAAMLQHLIAAPPQLEKLEGLKTVGKEGETGGENFAFQYAHARCCSLLQMAHRQGLITLKPINAPSSSALWLLVTPLPVPWFNEQICFFHPDEWSLISELVAILDELYCPFSSRHPPKWDKATLKLSQAFQTFLCHCRIWGEVKSQNLPLAQARLGLILITQSVLRLLLQDKLGIVAPSEV